MAGGFLARRSHGELIAPETGDRFAVDREDREEKAAKAYIESCTVHS
jgi:hypothetical protein